MPTPRARDEVVATPRNEERKRDVVGAAAKVIEAVEDIVPHPENTNNPNVLVPPLEVRQIKTRTRTRVWTHPPSDVVHARILLLVPPNEVAPRAMLASRNPDANPVEDALIAEPTRIVVVATPKPRKRQTRTCRNR